MKKWFAAMVAFVRETKFKGISVTGLPLPEIVFVLLDNVLYYVEKLSARKVIYLFGTFVFMTKGVIGGGYSKIIHAALNTYNWHE